MSTPTAIGFEDDDWIAQLVTRLLFENGDPPATEIRPDDLVFNIGLDSLEQVYVVKELEDKLQIEIPDTALPVPFTVKVEERDSR